MLEGDWLRSTLDDGEGDKRVVGGRGSHRLDGRAGNSEFDDGSSAGSKVLGARLPRVLHIALPSASRGWRRAVCALAAVLLLLLGAGGTAAQDTLPTVSVSDAEAYEDGWSVNFAVSLSQPSSEEVTVEFATSSGTATMGTDFRGGSLMLTFPPNRKDPRRVSVRLIDDLAREPDETFTVTLTNPVGATLGNATATGTIRNDDTAAALAASGIGDTTATLTISGHTGGWWYKGNDWIGIESPCTAVAAGTTAVSIGGLTAAIRYDYRAYSDSTCTTRLAKVRFYTLAPEGTPTVSVSDAEVSEDGTWMTFDVSLSQPSREPVTVHFQTSGGTATSGTDFGAVSKTVTFPANIFFPTKTVNVHVNDDQEPESDETFTVTLRNPVGATLGDATATGTIRDDGDTAATLTPGDIEDTTATLVIGGHAGGWWYRGRSSGTSSPWGGCTAVAAGTTAVGITGLTTVTTYEYWAYSDSACTTKLANVEFDTLAPAGTPTVSISDAELSEDGGSMKFKVSLSQPSRERVTVWYVVWDGTATDGTDFDDNLPMGNFVSFSANSSDTTGHVSVRLIDDQEPEPDETFTLTLTRALNATLGDATATGTILDDGDTAARLTASDIEDTTATLTISGHTEGWWYRGRTGTSSSSPWGSCTAVTAGTTAVGISGLVPVAKHEYWAFSDSACSTKLAKLVFRTIAPEGTPTVSVSDATVSEDGRWMTFRVSLSHPSREPVEVRFVTSDGTATGGTDFDAREGLRAGRAYFSANSSTTIYHVNVRVNDDQEPEPDETFTVTLTNPVGATLGDATATGTIVDDGDTAATLTASDIEHTTATLTIGGHTDGWWYRHRELGASRWGACTAVSAGTTAVGIGGLMAVTDYEFTAYSDSACSTKLARVAFVTLAAEGVTPTVSVSDAEVSEDGAWMQFRVSLSQPSREEVTVDVQTSGGTATSGTDFRAMSHTVTFSANSREPEWVPVLVHDDQDRESDETFTVTLTNPVGATLGNATATGTIKDDDTAETGVAVVSGPGDDATYGLGDTIRVAVTFGEAVTVDTTGGTPSLAIDMDPADWGEKRAAYESGTGTDTLIFVHEVVEPNLSTQGVAVLADSLKLNGGTIHAATTGADAALGHAGLDHDPDHKVDWRQAATPALTASFHDVPASHGGEDSAFSFGLVFSEALVRQLSSATLRNEALRATNATVIRTKRVVKGDNRRWTVTVRPDSGADVTVSLPATADCATAGALCTPDGRPLSNAVTATVAGQPLTASFHDVPASHGGEDSAFSFGLVFSEALVRQLSSATLRNEALSATNATVVRTKRVVKGDNRRWTVTVQPDSGADVTVSLPATTDCAAAGALCTPDGRGLSNAVTATVSTAETATESPAAPSVTGVSVVSSPTSGSTYMLGETIRIRATFSESVSVTGSPRLSIDMDPAAWGTKQAAYASGSGTTALDFVHTVVEPNYSTQGIAVLANSLALNGGTIRSAGGTDAALAHTGLGHASGHKVDWRPSISVADARADEGAGAVVAFEVSLSRAFTTTGHSVTVDYATADGTATAGEDYAATSGTLTFAAGESSKTVNVTILDDSHDEGNETFVLRLSNATGARIADGEATGTIANEDPLQTMWLSRFGRAVASDAVATVTARLQTPRDAGSHLTLAGQRVPLDGSGDGRALADALPGFAQTFDAPPLPVHADDPFAHHGLTGAWTDSLASAPARRVTGRELLLGTSFRAVLASDAGMQLTSWGQGASLSRFSGAVPGLSLSGETASGALGMDYERGRLLTGFAMMHSVGDGTAHDEGRRYTMGSTVTTLLPYARYALSERVSAWGLAGTGTGSLALGLDTGVSARQRTDLSLTLAATGVRGELLSPAEAGGFALALKADAFWVRTESDAVSAPGVGNLAAARGESSRVRAVLDGSRTFAFPGGATLTPSVELGVRHDGGDAEIGTGVELGAGLGYADPSRGLDMALRVHGLSAHAGDGYSEWGVSGSLRLVPGDAGRGLSASLTPSYGVDPGSSQRLWMLPDADAMAATDDVPLSSRLDAEVGYGMAAFDGRFTGTPHVGFGLSDTAREVRLGWRLTPVVVGYSGFELDLGTVHRESVIGVGAWAGHGGLSPESAVGAGSEHELMLRGAVRW